MAAHQKVAHIRSLYIRHGSPSAVLLFLIHLPKNRNKSAHFRSAVSVADRRASPPLISANKRLRVGATLSRITSECMLKLAVELKVNTKLPSVQRPTSY